MTALMIASERGWDEIVELLTRNGADVTKQNEEIVELLTRKGADVTKQNEVSAYDAT